MSAIKPVFSLLHEATMIFALGFPVPWFRMKFQPSVLLLAPVSKEFLRNRLGEAKSDKVRCLRLRALRVQALARLTQGSCLTRCACFQPAAIPPRSAAHSAKTTDRFSLAHKLPRSTRLFEMLARCRRFVRHSGSPASIAVFQDRHLYLRRRLTSRSV